MTEREKWNAIFLEDCAEYDKMYKSVTVKTIPPYKLVTVKGIGSNYVEDFDCSKIMLGDEYFKLYILEGQIRQFSYKYYKIIRNYEIPAQTLVFNEPYRISR